MSLPGADILEKLKGFELDSQDRARLDIALLFCAGVIVALLVWKPPVDPKIAELAMSNAWIAGCVALVVYIAGVRVKRTTRAPKGPAEPPPTLGNTKS